jgi:hypothetical protein
LATILKLGCGVSIPSKIFLPLLVLENSDFRKLIIVLPSETTVFDATRIGAFLGVSLQAKRRKMGSIINAKFFISNDL